MRLLERAQLRIVAAEDKQPLRVEAARRVVRTRERRLPTTQHAAPRPVGPYVELLNSGSAYLRPDQPPKTRSFSAAPSAELAVCSVAEWPKRADGFVPRSTASYQTSNSGSYESIVFSGWRVSVPSLSVSPPKTSRTSELPVTEPPTTVKVCQQRPSGASRHWRQVFV